MNRKNILNVAFTLSAILALSTSFHVSSSFADETASAPPVVAPAQPAQAAQIGGTQPAIATTAAAPQPNQPSMMGMAMPFLIMLGIMYFLMIRPQQKKAKEHQTLLSGLKNGDEVITTSGILGTVTGMSEKVVTLEVSKNVQLKMLKSQVNQIVKGPVQELRT